MTEQTPAKHFKQGPRSYNGPHTQQAPQQTQSIKQDQLATPIMEFTTLTIQGASVPVTISITVTVANIAIAIAIAIACKGERSLARVRVAGASRFSDEGFLHIRYSRVSLLTGDGLPYSRTVPCIY